MILTQEIRNLVLKWGLRDNVIEKDYVLGWLLWGIATVPELNNHWAFKGGTSLKKCYIDTWRFSEDLDFTVLPGGPTNPKTIEPLIVEVLERVSAASGIDFSVAPPVFKYSAKYIYTEGRIYYRGPLRARRPARVKLDISGLEETVCSTVLRNISHTYSDVFPDKSQIRCYSFEEIFAEKIRTMGERSRPRDLYDIVLLFKQKNDQLKSSVIKQILREKCISKGVVMPTLQLIQKTVIRNALLSEWKNMLGHQLTELPSFEHFWSELPKIFDWLQSGK